MRGLGHGRKPGGGRRAGPWVQTGGVAAGRGRWEGERRRETDIKHKGEVSEGLQFSAG